jgi:hypothetical protein
MWEKYRLQQNYFNSAFDSFKVFLMMMVVLVMIMMMMMMMTTTKMQPFINFYIIVCYYGKSSALQE